MGNPIPIPVSFTYRSLYDCDIVGDGWLGKAFVSTTVLELLFL